jgi:hypothetical protein
MQIKDEQLLVDKGNNDSGKAAKSKKVMSAWRGESVGG